MGRDSITFRPCLPLNPTETNYILSTPDKQAELTVTWRHGDTRPSKKGNREPLAQQKLKIIRRNVDFCESNCIITEEKTRDFFPNSKFLSRGNISEKTGITTQSRLLVTSVMIQIGERLAQSEYYVCHMMILMPPIYILKYE